MKSNTLIYHYTTLESFLKIIESNTFWITSAQYLNDYSEGLNGKKYIRDISNAIKNINYDISNIVSIQNNFVSTFILSFCSNGDLLSQWKYYGNGMCGISVGFNKDKIIEYQTKLNYKLVDIQYTEESHKILLSSIIEDVEQLLKTPIAQGNCMKPIIEYIEKNQTILNSILYKMYSCKDEIFKDEEESRIICTSYDFNTKSRFYHNVILPYVELIFENILSFVDEIILNPNATERIVDSVKDYLKTKNFNLKYGDPEIIVRKSSIPFIG